MSRKNERAGRDQKQKLLQQQAEEEEGPAGPVTLIMNIYCAIDYQE